MFHCPVEGGSRTEGTTVKETAVTKASQSQPHLIAATGFRKVFFSVALAPSFSCCQQTLEEENISNTKRIKCRAVFTQWSTNLHNYSGLLETFDESPCFSNVHLKDRAHRNRWSRGLYRWCPQWRWSGTSAHAHMRTLTHTETPLHPRPPHTDTHLHLHPFNHPRNHTTHICIEALRFCVQLFLLAHYSYP